MRRSVWIFFAAIFLPSLGLAWMAISSIQDQQVVMEHQQVIIDQNVTDALAKSVQAQMDQVRGDFVKTTQHLLEESPSAPTLATNFNKTLRDFWPMAEIGFAVNIDGQIYSPKPFDGPGAKTFRDENDRFLSNRENVEVYSQNSNVADQFSGGQLKVVTSTYAPPEKEAGADKQLGDGQRRLDELVSKKAKDSVPVGRTEEISEAQSARVAPVAKPVMDANDVVSAAAHATLAAPAPAVGSTNSISVPAADFDKIKSATTTSLTPAAPKKTEDLEDKAGTAPAPADSSENASSVAGKFAPAGDSGSMESTVVSASSAPDSAPADAAALATARLRPFENTATTPSAVAAPPPAPSNGKISAGPANEPVMQSIDVPTTGAEIVAKSLNSFTKTQRQVIPQQMLTRDTAPTSNTVPAESDFRRVIGAETSGALARFLEDKLRLMVWSRPTDTSIVFGAQLNQAKLAEALKAALQIPELTSEQDSFSRSRESAFCVAILDDMGKPVIVSRDGFKGDWKHPFVATEIGEVLPHWEAALYLVDPDAIGRAARTLRLTLGLIVLLLVAAIFSGGSLIAMDVRRQTRLAQQKTDFVSNVSHELKTPLTSIRMFADLLAEKRVPDEERQATYLRIIAAEASRLTRLINNVLDFARLERGAPHGKHADCDMVEAVRDVVETCGPHLEAAGITFRSEIEAESLPIRGDRDALAQIILNLVSNAEKYGGNDVLVRVRRQETASGALACVDVLDRGAGIPAAQARTIFEPFHRLDDSLSSGIPGSGLGLTLARRMARAHGGDVTYSARAGGGSCFTLTVPMESQRNP